MLPPVLSLHPHPPSSDSQVSHTEDLRALNAMFGKLKKRVERGDPLRLSSQMDEIRNDVNMLMRTMGMKIHATPLLRFRDTMNQMRREGKVSMLGRSLRAGRRTLHRDALAALLAMESTLGELGRRDRFSVNLASHEPKPIGSIGGVLVVFVLL